MAFWRPVVRSLLRSPAYAATAVLTAALVAAVGAASLTLLYGAFLRPWLNDRGGQLVVVEYVAAVSPAGSISSSRGVSPLDVRDRRERSAALEDFAFARSNDLVTVGLDDGARIVAAGFVSADFFRALRAPLILGRVPAFGALEVLLGYDFWLQRFGGDPDVVGRPLRVGGDLHTVVGVAPRAVRFPGPVPAVWLPVSSDQAHGERRARRYTGLARLAPGVSLAEAAAEADRVDAALTHDYPGVYDGVDTRIVPLLERYTAPVRGLLVLAAAAVVLVFAAGAASLSNLAVLRAAAQSGEAATRAALGATRLRRLSEAAAEQLLVAAVGGALGWCLWRWTAAASAALLPAGLAPDGYAASSALAAVFSFAFAALAALAAVVVSEVPAAGGRVVLTGAPDLRTGSRTRRAAHAAAVVQVALSLVLVHAAFVFQGALDSLRNTDLGFHNRGVLSTFVDLRVARDPAGGQRTALVDRLIERLEAVPGVARAAAGLGIPPDTLFNVVQLPRRVPATGIVEPYVLDLVPVSPGYFDVLGVPLLDGRAFGPGDAAGADPVIVLSESAARRFFGRADAAGRTLEVYPIAVAGVVGDVRYRGFREPPAETAYYALAQYPVIGVHLLVHGVGGFVPSASAVAAAVYDVEPGLALGEVRVVGEPGPGDVGVPTAEAFLVAVLAGFAVLQMLVALYGAAAYSAARRRPEYALRAALGAAPARLLAAALRESLLQTVLGLLAGAGLTAAAARVLPALVSAPGIHEPGVPAYLAAAAVVTAVAAGSSLAAVRGVLRVDPASVLRSG